MHACGRHVTSRAWDLLCLQRYVGPGSDGGDGFSSAVLAPTPNAAPTQLAGDGCVVLLAGAMALFRMMRTALLTSTGPAPLMEAIQRGGAALQPGAQSESFLRHLRFELRALSAARSTLGSVRRAACAATLRQLERVQARRT